MVRAGKIKGAGGVVYVAAEGGYGFGNRVAALRRTVAYRKPLTCPWPSLRRPVDLLDPAARPGCPPDSHCEADREGNGEAGCPGSDRHAQPGNVRR